MIRHFARPAVSIATAVMLGLSPLVVAHAQTNDEARLTLGIAAGYLGARPLWDVAMQPVYLGFNEPDIFHLRREMHSDITVSGHATYFQGPHFGLTGEFTYLGLGTRDSCSIVHDNGNVELQQACTALEGAVGTASTTVVNVGAVYRPLSRTLLQPYLKVTGGLAFTPSSTVALRSTYGNIADTALIITIYKDDDWKDIRPTWTLGFGISTAPSSGYQIRVEARETWLTLSAITAPTLAQGFVPEHSSVLKGFLSVLVGFDIVLAKQRGRRY